MEIYWSMVRSQQTGYFTDSMTETNQEKTHKALEPRRENMENDINLPFLVPLKRLSGK